MLIHITGSFTCLLSREQKMGYDIGKHDGKQTDAEDFSNSAASQRLSRGINHRISKTHCKHSTYISPIVIGKYSENIAEYRHYPCCYLHDLWFSPSGVLFL
jgi:hypothetical protein